MTQWKVGDWCFSNFELCQIKEMKGDKITSVSDGQINRSGFSLNYCCFPLDMKIKRISDAVKYWYDRLHALNGISLNYPDIVRHLESVWVSMCESKGNDTVVNEMNDLLKEFCLTIIQKVETIRRESTNGIQIFR